jgi:hypothetical protein
MTTRRLLLTSSAMAAVAFALTVLAPAFSDMADVLAHPQRTVDRAGPEHVVLTGTGLLAWLFWGWGALGLALTAASTLPGLPGRSAGRVLHVVLPAGGRRGAALVLGLGLGVTAPLAVPALTFPPAAHAAVPQGHPAVTVPDWPAALRDLPGDPVPDWPAAPPAPAAGAHVVVRGDCLWSIAETRLADELGHEPTAGEVASAVGAWWTANADVIGPDPDHIRPGQVLRPPGAP